MSLEDWDMLTWSLGWTGVLDPSWPPSISMARLEMTCAEPALAPRPRIFDSQTSYTPRSRSC